MPLLESDFYVPYNSRGLEILAVCLDVDESRVKGTVAPFSLSYPILVDQGAMIARSYKVTGIPLNIIVDKKGVIQYRKAGYDPEGMRSVIEKLL